MLAAVTGQIGCLTLVVVLAAVLGGLYVDSRFQTRPLFTLIFVVASIPVSLALMFWVARTAVSKIKAQAQDVDQSQPKEVAEVGRSEDD